MRRVTLGPRGGVENANNVVETHFESRLRFEPVGCVEELNAAALKWSRDWNANLLAKIDSRVLRESGERFVRDDLWGRIALHAGALRELPSREVCQWFMAGREVQRQVRNLEVSFSHPELGRSAAYDLRPWAEHVHNGQKVAVVPLLLRDGAVRLEIGRVGSEPLVVEVEPVRGFDAAGRRLDAQVFGEGYARAPESAGERMARELAQAAFGEGVSLDEAQALRERNVRPFAHVNDGKGLVAHSQLGAQEPVRRLLPAADGVGTDAVRAAAAALREVRAAPLSHVEAAVRLRRVLGDVWGAQHFAWLVQRWPDGVPEGDLEAAAAWVRGGGAVALQAVASAAVGGA